MAQFGPNKALSVYNLTRHTFTLFASVVPSMHASISSILGVVCSLQGQSLTLRGGNGSDPDRIVFFPYLFPYFENKYGYGCCSNTNSEQMLLKYEYTWDVFSIYTGYEYRSDVFLNTYRLVKSYNNCLARQGAPERIGELVSTSTSISWAARTSHEEISFHPPPM
jgi:hypothetical protein